MNPPAEKVRTGKPFGRWTWRPAAANATGAPRRDSGDWVPTQDGTHEAYHYAGTVWLIERT